MSFNSSPCDPGLPYLNHNSVWLVGSGHLLPSHIREGGPQRPGPGAGVTGVVAVEFPNGHGRHLAHLILTSCSSGLTACIPSFSLFTFFYFSSCCHWTTVGPCHLSLSFPSQCLWGPHYMAVCNFDFSMQSWCGGLNEECLLQALVFEHLFPNG